MLLLVMMASFLIIQVALFSTKASLRDLIRSASNIGLGHFDLKFKYKGWGEISALIEAFSQMSKSLVERDLKIVQLHKEETEKIRLASELDIASRLQKNFLPDAPLSRESGLDVFGTYVPALETAGDWYNFHYNDKTGEAIVAIADVSGHGAGSSMFTAIIAGSFYDLAKASERPFDAQHFANKLNVVFAGIGKRQWHSTLLVLIYNKNNRELKITTAGCTPPLYVFKGDDGGISSKFVNLPSSVIGLESNPLFATKTLILNPGEQIVVATDGLFEARNAANKMYGKKRMALLCAKQMEGLASRSMVETIYQDWLHYQKPEGGPVSAEDDLCIIALRVLA
jgi:sigma-B regulation protein RsbU (phosphoserine phosphatase)